MTNLKKPALIAVLLGGAAFATVALAEMGPGGHDDRGMKLVEMFDQIDTDKDGKLSMAELEAHRAAEFKAADTNADGALDATELAARELARFQEKLADRTQEMIDNKDNDGNGSLSADEIGKGPAEDHFARIDTDNDGMISKDEAQAAMKHHRKHGHGMGGQGMNSQGMDGDEEGGDEN